MERQVLAFLDHLSKTDGEDHGYTTEPGAWEAHVAQAEWEIRGEDGKIRVEQGVTPASAWIRAWGKHASERYLKLGRGWKHVRRAIARRLMADVCGLEYGSLDRQIRNHVNISVTVAGVVAKYQEVKGRSPTEGQRVWKRRTADHFAVSVKTIDNRLAKARGSSR
jgi:hypothetical protein